MSYISHSKDRQIPSKNSRNSYAVPTKNSERFLVQELKAFAAENGLQLEEFCHQWAHKLTKPQTGKSTFVFGYDLGLNPSSVAQICRDKVASSEVLEASGIPVIPHRLIIQPNLISYAPNANADKVLKQVFDESDGHIVVKPNEGTGGRDVYRLQSLAQAITIIERLHSEDKAVAVSPYIESECEWRVYLLKGEAKIVVKKTPRIIKGDGYRDIETLARVAIGEEAVDEILHQTPHLSEEWKTFGVLSVGQSLKLNWRNNLGQGAIPELVDISIAPRKVVELATEAAKVLNLVVGSVDTLETNVGLKVLEINAGAMMERISLDSKFAKTVSELFYREALHCNNLLDG